MLPFMNNVAIYEATPLHSPGIQPWSSDLCISRELSLCSNTLLQGKALDTRKPDSTLVFFLTFCNKKKNKISVI